MDKINAALALLGLFAIAGLFSYFATPALGDEVVGGILIVGLIGGTIWLARRMRKG